MHEWIGAIRQKQNTHLKIGYTIEFFPEEGKYHWSGHRACNIRYNPKEIKEKGAICPICKQPLTVGVENRVIDLSYKTIDPATATFKQWLVGISTTVCPLKNCSGIPVSSAPNI